MKSLVIISAFFFVVQAMAQAPNNVKCVKEARGMGLRAVDAYQACSLTEEVHACVVAEQRANAKTLSGVKLAEAGKKAIEKCQSK